MSFIFFILAYKNSEEKRRVFELIFSGVQAVTSNRQTEALVLVICFIFVVQRHQKQPKFPGREFNHGHCLTHNPFLRHCFSHNLLLSTALD